MSTAIVITSGKGGTGKTSLTGGVGSCLAALGKRVLCIDMDVGLRNLDLSLGMADRVLMDFTDVLAGYCTLEDDTLPLEEYLACGRQAQAEAKARRSIQEDPEESLDKLFVSSLPWVSYTALVQPVPQPADSHPRISWGKYFLQEGRTLLPVSILCHHALVDGLHLAAFYQALDRELAEAAG